MNLLLFVIAIGAGIALSVQAAVNARLAAVVGNDAVLATWMSFATGTVLITAVVLARGGLGTLWQALPDQPWWRLSGGVLGGVAVVATVFLVPRIGLANMVALVIAGQLLSSVAMDHHGWLGMAVREATLPRLLGLGIVALGVLLTLYGDQWLARVRATG